MLDVLDVEDEVLLLSLESSVSSLGINGDHQGQSALGDGIDMNIVPIAGGHAG